MINNWNLTKDHTLYWGGGLRICVNHFGKCAEVVMTKARPNETTQRHTFDHQSINRTATDFDDNHGTLLRRMSCWSSRMWEMTTTEK